MPSDHLAADLCENIGCGKPVECFVCETCAEHCALKDPEACWEAHEAWRLGKPDPAFAGVHCTVTKPGRPITINGVPIPPARRPRRLS